MSIRAAIRTLCVSGIFAFSNPATGSLLAQDLGTRKNLMDLSSDLKFVGSGTGIASGTAETRIKGSPYTDTTFYKGLLYVKSGEIYSGIPMRYNAFSDDVEVRLADGGIHLLSNKGQIEKAEFNQKEMVYAMYSESGKEETGFFTLLYKGNYCLYERTYKIFREGTPSNGIVPETPPAIVDKPVQYFLSVGAGLPELIQGKKDLFTVSGTHRAALEAFLKKEKPDLRSPEGLTAVIRYLDSL
jgi:hypothetical protein